VICHYWIVAADARSKRDGKFLEKLGTYNPNTNPATIDLKVDNTVTWLQHGAQPSDTAKAILSYKGVLLKHHLLGGVAKGALTEEQAEEKFQAWIAEKDKSVAGKVATLDKAKEEAKAKALAAEKEVNEKRALAAVEAEAPAEEAATEEVAEAAAETAEAVAEEAPASAENDSEDTPAAAASSEEE